MSVPGTLLQFAYKCLVLLAKSVNIDEIVLKTAEKISKEHNVVTAGGMLYWFVALKTRTNIPKYNIYHLFVGDLEKRRVCAILKSRLDNYRVAKQYYLMKDSDLEDKEFSSFIRNTLHAAIRDGIKKTNYKKNTFSVDTAKHALRDVNSFFREHDAKLFLVSGTLLGFIRNGGPIEGDNDIDLGIFGNDSRGLIAIENLLTMPWVRRIHKTPDFVQITHANATIIDIFIHQKIGDKVWHGTDIHRWHNSPFELEERKFSDLNVFVPRDHEKYLNENYGNWRQPALFWDYSFDTPNRDFCANRKSILYLVERALSGIQAEPPDRYLTETALSALAAYFNIALDYQIGSQERERSSNRSESEKSGSHR